MALDYHGKIVSETLLNAMSGHSDPEASSEAAFKAVAALISSTPEHERWLLVRGFFNSTMSDLKPGESALKTEVVLACHKAAQDAYTSISRDQYVMTGPAGLARCMLNAILAVAPSKELAPTDREQPDASPDGS